MGGGVAAKTPSRSWDPYGHPGGYLREGPLGYLDGEVIIPFFTIFPPKRPVTATDRTGGALLATDAVHAGRADASAKAISLQPSAFSLQPSAFSHQPSAP